MQCAAGIMLAVQKWLDRSAPVNITSARKVRAIIIDIISTHRFRLYLQINFFSSETFHFLTD